MAAAIRLLTPADLQDAAALSNTAGWNQRLEDWRRLVAIAPRGSFCATDQGRIVGTAIGIDYGTFGWIAMMLVDPSWRGRGLGAALLESAIGALPAANPIRLDATPLGRPLYRRYGFEDETMLSRRVRQPDSRPMVAPESRAIQRLEDADLPGVWRRDLAVFGADRGAILRSILDERPHYAQLAADANEAPQYCFGRPGRLFEAIGPVVAADATTAAALVTAVVNQIPDRPVVIDAFDAHTMFAAWLDRAGFAVQRPLYRMCRRGDATTSLSGELAEYAILGPEFG